MATTGSTAKKGAKPKAATTSGNEDGPGKALGIIALLFVLGFAVMWVLIGWKVWQFKPSDTAKKYEVSGPLITVAGALGGAVAACTASVLGIKIVDAMKTATVTGVRTAAKKVATTSPLLWTIVVIYVVVGFYVGTVWLSNPDESPDVVGSFATGVLGWGLGALAGLSAANSQ